MKWDNVPAVHKYNYKHGKKSEVPQVIIPRHALKQEEQATSTTIPEATQHHHHPPVANHNGAVAEADGPM